MTAETVAGWKVGRAEYIPGETRDIPHAPEGRAWHQSAPSKPAGLDWDALTPRCSSCGQPSGQLADGARCPTCRGVTPVDVFATARKRTGTDQPTEVPDRLLTPDRIPSDGTRLGDDLADLEATEPEVDAAAQWLDDAVRRITQPDDHITPPAPAAATTGEPTAAAGSTTAPGASLRDGGDRPAAGTGKGKPTRQPATTGEQTPSNQSPNHASAQVSPGEQTTRETTVTSPPFPTYIVDIAVVMRDSETHHDPAVRAACKQVANALVTLNRALTKAGSPAASTRPDEHLGSARPGRLDAVKAEVIATYQAGLSATQLAARYGVSDVTIRASLRRWGVRLRTKCEAQKTRTTNPTGATA